MNLTRVQLDPSKIRWDKLADLERHTNSTQNTLDDEQDKSRLGNFVYREYFICPAKYT